MDDLISRSALLAEMELDEPDSIDENNRAIKAMRGEWKHWMKKIKRFPAVDAVEVVRCKDCRRFKPHEERPEFGFCKLYPLGLAKHENGFCEHGERKADA